MKILCATSEAGIAACYPVFKVLRPHLIEAEFVPQVQRQQAEGYRLMYIAKSKQVVAAAGYRFQDAHRLYLNKGLQLTSHHFSMKLPADSKRI